MEEQETALTACYNSLPTSHTRGSFSAYNLLTWRCDSVTVRKDPAIPKQVYTVLINTGFPQRETNFSHLFHWLGKGKL